ncbi:MAG: M23 family metallopeptidase [Alistipes sp.]|nr:M23 family metallopeptidase [Alistipes sp.]
MPKIRRTIRYARPRTFKQKAIRHTLHALIGLGAATLYYIGFSFFFDTPVEYELKHSTDRLHEEYGKLEARYDSLMTVMRNVSERDRNVFRILFESEPYDFDSEYEEKRLLSHESSLGKSNRELNLEMRDRIRELEKTMTRLEASFGKMRAEIERSGDDKNLIPAIQPVINEQLTLLTASYGMRIHPFYRTLHSHQGVDYTVPEGSRVFATADGRVKETASRSTSGRTVVIDHGNGYETLYSHLLAMNVEKGQEVRRGDIIGLSGNSGLSIAPHLHYEVRHNGLRVDPIHYFFMELSPVEYQRIMRIAQSGMQSFD